MFKLNDVGVMHHYLSVSQTWVPDLEGDLSNRSYKNEEDCYYDENFLLVKLIRYLTHFNSLEVSLGRTIN